MDAKTKTGQKRWSIFQRHNIEFAFHAIALALYSRVWLWHTSPAALALPGATGFGWFFRYLTFCSYTLQLIQFFLGVLRRILPSSKARYVASVAGDRLACALFGLSNTITAMYYTIESAGKGMVDASRPGAKPWWLGGTVHVLNSVIAWIDLFLVEERTFHGQSRHLVALIAMGYCCWSLLVKRMHGSFPYPILDVLPFPWGFAGIFAVAFLVMSGLFELGRFLKHGLGKKSLRQKHD